MTTRVKGILIEKYYYSNIGYTLLCITACYQSVNEYQEIETPCEYSLYPRIARKNTKSDIGDYFEKIQAVYLIFLPTLPMPIFRPSR